MWHCGEWETIKKSLPENNLGSRIVTTTRYNAITNKWRDDFDVLVHKIDYNGHFLDESTLAWEMIEMSADMDGENIDYDHPIAVMCVGMPLAVVCMISALAKERARQEQQGLCVVRTCDVQDGIEQQVKQNGIQNTPGFELLVESLELGYNHLPHHMLKTCLLYCSIYPEDHGLRRADLVRRWIAEGFVCTAEAAKDYFDELVSRRLIIDGSLHPMMRNYLRRKLREDNFITCTSDGVPSSPVGRLCMDCWPSSDAVDPLSGIDWHHIRSLVVFKDAERVPYKHLQHLRVLDVQYNRVLEQQHDLKDMCGLLCLRHLFVSGGQLGINEMPAEIARLQYLETLEVSKTGIRRLPAEVGDLKQLKSLDVSWNEELAELPREMRKLQHLLERLRISGSRIREQAWEIIGTLKKLKTLDVSYNNELSGIPRYIGELQQLTDLYVCRNSRITELPKEIGKLQHLETLDVSQTGITELPKEIGNLQHLKTLDLSYTGITELPSEIGNLQHLQALYLNDVKTITKLPRDIGRLQHLERLHLRNTNVRKIPREIGGLKKLKDLDEKIGTLPFEAGQLPKLEGLPKCVQKAWKNTDLVSSLAGEFLSFEKTDRIGDGGLIVGTKHMHIPQWIREHFNNVGTLDIRICKLEEQDLKILREMPNLHELKLRFEAVPRKPIDISSGGFARLVGLTVDSRVPRITFHEGAMPRLFWLTFEFQFYGGLPPNPMGIKNLVYLKRVRFRCNNQWYPGDSPCISATIEFVRKEAREHRNKTIELTLSVGDLERHIKMPEIAQCSHSTSTHGYSNTNLCYYKLKKVLLALLVIYLLYVLIGHVSVD
ncbi:hypothetical protein BDA96_02G063800 [Sorghum bicolor]|jgi:Leucine-rich repeat (LRR) protein|uniref:NB-ARC domain-containing protein n=2 Tax=Sorghum bicolor TaxID=4558 RepID=A0A921RKJ0_SORBI|nr:hypothetical protein BDA96_02G063800 [Sorghum bicolor]OQU88617.1 hypothetical protein SORBI_3002G063566 [Sorghum bicolor]